VINDTEVIFGTVACRSASVESMRTAIA
jgi:hypothetical protein